VEVFTDRVAVVTGGASGIGLGIARALGQRGMKLMIADLNEETIESAVRALRVEGVQAEGVRCDVSKLEDVEGLAAATLE